MLTHHSLKSHEIAAEQQLATKAIEKIIDPSAPAEEQASRKRRLLKGPEEFREGRVDRAKGEWEMTAPGGAT
jgi:hypothetical protein